MSSKKAKSNTDLVRLLCWSCGKRVKVPTKFAGKTGTCPKCKSKIQIPTLKTIKSTIKELEKQNQQKKLEDIDFPSLPSLKVLSLGDEEAPMSNNLSLSINPPSGSDGTGELIISNTEMSADEDFDISNELGKVDSPAFDSPKAVKPSRSVKPNDQFITSADEQFYNEIAGAGLEKTETWGESQEVKAADTNSGIFHTPSSQQEAEDSLDSLGGEDFDVSSFEAEPIDNQDNDFADSFKDPLSSYEEDGLDISENPFEMGDIDDNIPVAEPFDMGEVDADMPMAEPFDMGEVDADMPMAEPFDMGIDADMAEDFEPNEDISNVDIADAEEIEEEIEDDISSVHEIEEVEVDESDGEELEDDVVIEGSEILSEDVVNDVADAVFINSQSENSEIAITDESFQTNYNKILEEEDISGNNDLSSGWQCFREKKWEETLYYFTKCIIEKQETATAHYARSLLYICEGNWDNALKDITSAKKQGYHKADVENRYNQIIFNYARNCWETGAFEKALQYINKIETKDSQILRGKVFWKRAQFLIEHGAYKKALSDLDDAIFHNYVKAEIFAARGKIYFRQGDYESAIYDFTAAMNREYKNIEMLRARSEANFYIGKMEEALSDINEAINLDEQCAPLYTLKGIILTQKNNFAEANTVFQTALSLEPNNHHHYFNRGLANIIQKRYDRAVDDFSKAVQYNKKDKVAYFKRAICYQEKTNPNLIQAREDFKTADQMSKDSMYRTNLFEE